MTLSWPVLLLAIFLAWRGNEVGTATLTVIGLSFAAFWYFEAEYPFLFARMIGVPVFGIALVVGLVKIAKGAPQGEVKATEQNNG